MGPPAMPRWSTSPSSRHCAARLPGRQAPWPAQRKSNTRGHGCRPVADARDPEARGFAPHNAAPAPRRSRAFAVGADLGGQHETGWKSAPLLQHSPDTALALAVAGSRVEERLQARPGSRAPRPAIHLHLVGWRKSSQLLSSEVPMQSGGTLRPVDPIQPLRPQAARCLHPIPFIRERWPDGADSAGSGYRRVALSVPLCLQARTDRARRIELGTRKPECSHRHQVCNPIAFQGVTHSLGCRGRLFSRRGGRGPLTPFSKSPGIPLCGRAECVSPLFG